MLCRLSLAALVMLSTIVPSLAQMAPPLPLPLPFPSFQGTPEEQRACQPAVFRFCREAVPDTFRILQCLQRNRPHIGPACQHVLASNGV
jgi:hypothetical protein